MLDSRISSRDFTAKAPKAPSSPRIVVLSPHKTLVPLACLASCMLNGRARRGTARGPGQAGAPGAAAARASPSLAAPPPARPASGPRPRADRPRHDRTGAGRAAPGRPARRTRGRRCRRRAPRGCGNDGGGRTPPSRPTVVRHAGVARRRRVLRNARGRDRTTGRPSHPQAAARSPLDPRHRRLAVKTPANDPPRPERWCGHRSLPQPSALGWHRPARIGPKGRCTAPGRAARRSPPV
jgi:hypothetical protein